MGRAAYLNHSIEAKAVTRIEVTASPACDWAVGRAVN
jgi:hypothetical protein